MDEFKESFLGALVIVVATIVVCYFGFKLFQGY